MGKPELGFGWGVCWEPGGCVPGGNEGGVPPVELGDPSCIEVDIGGGVVAGEFNEFGENGEGLGARIADSGFPGKELAEPFVVLLPADETIGGEPLDHPAGLEGAVGKRVPVAAADDGRLPAEGSIDKAPRLVLGVAVGGVPEFKTDVASACRVEFEDGSRSTLINMATA